MNEQSHIDKTLLSAFADKEISGSETRQIESHMSACSSCRAELEQLRSLKFRLSHSPRRALPPELLAAMLERAESPWRNWLHKLFEPALWVPAGAMATASLIVGLWLSFAHNEARGSIPLAPLLAAHSRYAAENLVSDQNLLTANYSAQLNDESDDF